MPSLLQEELTFFCDNVSCRLSDSEIMPHWFSGKKCMSRDVCEFAMEYAPRRIAELQRTEISDSERLERISVVSTLERIAVKYLSNLSS